MKKLLALLMLVSVAFAQGSWVSVASMAVLVSLTALLILFMIGYGFGINELRFLSVEEIYQLFVTIIMIGLLYSASLYFDEFSRAVGFEEGLQNASITILENNLNNHSTMVSSLKSFALDLGTEASQSSFCSLQGPGYTVAPCSSYRAIIPSVSMAFQALSLSSAEVNSLLILAKFGRAYTFALLLPVGIILRTFRFTRGAGGLLIGFAVSLYLLLPLGVISMDIITSDFEEERSDYQEIPGLPSPDSSSNECDPLDAGTKNLNRAEGLFDSTRQNIKPYLYYFLIKGTLTTIICLILVITGIREISRLAGAEIDVSALARLA